ncbi:MAG: carboxylesterase family protein [Myxococcota bacterium]|nr:carboxylesterase family protein [Myxococcota bacterium]
MRRRPARPLLLLAALLAPCLVACGEPLAVLSGEAPSGATERALAQGRVTGFEHPDGGHVWLGIPFAEPPVGELRWRAPEPPAAWEGVREALRFGAPCAQIAGPLGARDGTGSGGATGSEDCLTLNVFAPALQPDAASDAAGLPVMVWIHGGGNSIGDATIYDGSMLAQRGQVIVVTVQYRLGVFGWLSHPALHGPEDDADDRSGNYGTLDLIRALEWVQENAGAFGGDPGRVTIFGESAGGANVMSLLRSPRARGLFHRAISQSGSVRGATLDEARLPEHEGGDAASSHELVVSLIERHGSAASREEAADQAASLTPEATERLLREADRDALLGLFDGSGFAGMYPGPRLIRDGHVLTGGGDLAPYESGDYAKVPVMLGTNRDENKLFLMWSSPHVSRVFGLPYRINDPRRYDLDSEYAALLWKARGVDEPAIAMRAGQGPSVYAYRFDWDDSPKRLWLDMGQLLGAAHGLEIPFVFGRLRLLPGTVFDPERAALDLELARAMQSYWARFAATGDPGQGLAGDLPRWSSWPAAGSGEPEFLVLDAPDDGGIHMTRGAVTSPIVVARVGTDERLRSTEERCAVWRDMVLYSDQLSAEAYAQIANGACQAHPLAEDAS